MWIELSEFNFKLFIPLIFPVFKRIQEAVKKSFMTKDNQIFKTFRYFTSYTLTFIFLIIIYFRSRKVKSENIEDSINDSLLKTDTISVKKSENLAISNNITELKNQNTKKKNIKSIIFLSALCLIGLFCYFFRYFFESDDYRDAKQSIGIFFDIAGYILLSYLILKQKLYKHNYISSGIIALILLILFIISAFYISWGFIWRSFFYYFFFLFCFVFYDILKKKYMNMFFSTPYFMMFVIGCVNVIIILIYDIIAYLVDNNNPGIITGLKLNITSAEKFFLMVLEIILQLCWNLGIWLTIYYLTPCHYFISEYISEYIYYIQNAIDSNEEFYRTINIVIFSIAYFINFFCCLVFNEVIILNFWDLDYNTNKRINERIQNESKEIPRVDTSDDNIMELNEKEDQSSN